MDVLSLPEMIKNRQSVIETTASYEFDEIPTRGPVTCAWTLRLGSVGLWVKADVAAEFLLPCTQTMDDTVVPFATTINEKLAFRQFADYDTEPVDARRERELKSDDDFFEVIDETTGAAHQLVRVTQQREVGIDAA